MEQNLNILHFNPWWHDGKVPSELRGKNRDIFDEIANYINVRQMVLLTGLRRVGKTTLMYQIINKLLEQGINRYNILYFSFDEIKYEPEEVLKQYEIEILKNDLAKQNVFIFFDEIQKLKNWPSKIKLLYDTYSKLKIFLTGSAQITMWKQTRESLAGRFFDFTIKPLSFDEYLEFKAVTIDKNREALFEKEIKWHLEDFIKTGGFIETLDMQEHMLKKYIKESLLERVIFIDISQEFKLDMPQLMFKLLEITASRPGFYLDYKNLSNDINIDQRTIANYVSYLEYSLFFQKLYNYSRNMLTSEKKTKKLYPSNTAFTFALNPTIEFPILLEQFFINNLDARFFMRNPQKEEIDMIHIQNRNIIPIEIKIQRKIDRSDIKNIYKFLKKNELKQGFIITLDTETNYTEKDITIEAIPYWKYWSLKNRL